MSMGALVHVSEIPTQEMRYDLRSAGMEPGKMKDAEVRRVFTQTFGEWRPRNTAVAPEGR